MGRLQHRVAIVTGAARGPRAALGSVFAQALAAEGAKVALADLLDCGAVAEKIEAAGGQALSLRADVREESSVAAMVEETLARFGTVDILVNNAAVGSNMPPVPVLELDVQAWDALYAVNVRGAFLCAKAVVPAMKRQHYGKIINIGSTTAMSGLPNRLHYVSSKGAVHAMTRALARELGGDGICVNTLAYGLVTSAFNERDLEADAAHRARVFGPRAMPVHLHPADIAGGLIYLAATESDHMTGQRLVVDPGGVHS